MRLIKDRTIVEDTWTHIDDADPSNLPDQAILPFSHWQELKDALKSGKLVGVLLTGDDNLQEVVPYLDQIELIALTFPAFTDGRCYTYAKLLRDRYGYKKEIRAVGDVLFDQVSYMERCGINAFETEDDSKLERILEAFSEFSEYYQPTNQADSIGMLRHSITNK